MGFFDFFKKKKTKEEEFQEAINTKDYLKVAEIGKEFLNKNPNSLTTLNFYVDSLVKLGKKSEALQTLQEFAEKKIREEYYDIAIAILKKALRIDPFNRKAISLLVKTYEKKELYSEAFKLLVDTYKKLAKSSEDVSWITELIEKLLETKFHPLFFESYGDLLAENCNLDKALEKYVLAGNMYVNLGDYKGALRSFLKARSIKRTENMDRQLIEILAQLKEDKASAVLLKILEENLSNPEFLKFSISTFKTAGSLDILKKIASAISSPKAKYYLLSGISFEEGEIEEGKNYLQALKYIDESYYNSLLSFIYANHNIDNLTVSLSQEESVKELPDTSDILSAFEEALETTPDYKIDDLSTTPEAHRNVDEEVKQLSEDGTKYISLAEAMLGLEKYEEAIKNAKKVLENPKHFLKAASIIVQALKSSGKYQEAVDFLTDTLHNKNLSETESAKLKALLGEVYEEEGKTERAILWYREANKILREEELSKKIEALSNSK